MSTEGNRERGALVSWATRPHAGPKRWAEARGLLGASKEVEIPRRLKPVDSRVCAGQAGAIPSCSSASGGSRPAVHVCATTRTMAMPTHSKHTGTSRVNEDS